MGDERLTEYPREYESDVVLRDGSTLRLRPIRPDDGPNLMDLFRRLSPESLYFRFFTVPKLDDAKAAELAQVDYDDQFALVGECGHRIVAVARYYRSTTDRARAEVAFTIADDLQGKGIGTRMLERLAVIARHRGIHTFDAFVLGDNRRMMDVFLDSGFEVRRRMQGGTFHVVLTLAETDAYLERAAERARMAATASMRAFFEPATIAVVGAARQPSKIGSVIFHNLRDAGFTGRLFPVNPNAADIDGIRAYPHVSAIPDPVDLAIVVVPAHLVAAVVDDCLAKPVKALLVITAGFAETGAAGREREAAIVEKIRAAGIRMIGPNCMGLINTDPVVRLNATFAPLYPPAGRVAMSTQSGALGVAILDYAQRLNIGISTFVSVGNKADVSGNDLIQYWASDPRTDVILLYLESFGNPRKFSQIARRVARQKPIIVVKSGRSRAGARAASSHTGALATSDTIVDALFRQAGVIRTGTLEELFDVAALLAHQPVPRGSRVAILTNAGGPGILAADACDAHGLELPQLHDATIAELRAFLPPEASVGNPVDMIASATAPDYERSLRALLSDDNIDSVLVIFIPPLPIEASDVASGILRAAASSEEKPVLATFMAAHGAPAMLAPIPCYMFPESAVAALARATAYGAWRRKPAGNPPELEGIDRAAARAIVEAALARGGGWLPPSESQALVAAVGIPVARAAVESSSDALAAAAATLGYPVVLKAVGPTIVHKTEVGGIKLGLADEASVRAAFAEFKERLGDQVTGVQVQQMVAGGVEVLLGAVTDPTFGSLVVCGTGGILVDLLADSVFRIHPLVDSDAAEMISEMKGAALLRGYRGAPRADEAALREAILRVSVLLEVCPEIQEMDINPLKVLSSGVTAVDVRARVDRRPIPPRTRRIVY